MNDISLLLNELRALCKFSERDNVAMRITHEPYVKRLTELHWIEIDNEALASFIPSESYQNICNKLSLKQLTQIFCVNLNGYTE